MMQINEDDVDGPIGCIIVIKTVSKRYIDMIEPSQSAGALIHGTV